MKKRVDPFALKENALIGCLFTVIRKIKSHILLISLMLYQTLYRKENKKNSKWKNSSNFR